MRFIHAEVRTRDGHRHPGEPAAFVSAGDALRVEDVIEHWCQASVDPSFFPEEYFRVRASDRRVYLLRYSHLFGSWWIRHADGGEV